ncbi:flagellar biosynthetic protein FliQ [Nitriliruptoraceae bacterium ZYF776]|nr:flagellar biosynthetic protein FliQ [Profundirhabdus halotolerans]
MNDAQVLELAGSAMLLVGKLAGPLLITALVIGVVVSLIQTVTQIQEMTLSFVPKLVGLGVVLLVAGNWMLRELVGWSAALWNAIPTLTG